MSVVERDATDPSPARKWPEEPAVAPRVRRPGQLSPSFLTGRSIWWLVNLLLILFFMVPIVWMLLATTKTDTQVLKDNPFSFGSLGGIRVAWDHLFAFQDGVLVTWIRNSVFYSFAALVITLVISIPAGYAMALTEFRGRKTLLTLTLLVMMMPTAALVLPLYLEMDKLGLTGTVWSVILPFSFFPFGAYLTYIYFSANVPADLLNSARLDGSTEWQVFRYIAMPLAKPIIALVAFFSFVGNWNNYFLPFVMLPDSDQYPAQVGLKILTTSSALFNTSSGVGNGILRPELALAAIITVIPVIVVFLFSQRALVSGMLAGATKE